MTVHIATRHQCNPDLEAPGGAVYKRNDFSTDNGSGLALKIAGHQGTRDTLRVVNPQAEVRSASSSGLLPQMP